MSIKSIGKDVRYVCQTAVSYKFMMIGKLKIGYFADGKWAHEAFKLIHQDKNMAIKFICVRYGTRDLVLKESAEESGIEYLCHKNINSENFLERIREFQCDLFVSMSFDQIFKTEIINIPRLKTINCHAGKLPYYRGRNILNWVLINDEEEFGITVHYIDEGIDTGDIILQKTFRITDNDDYNTLLNIAYKECAVLLYDSIKLIREGKHEPRKQADIHPVGFYCGVRQEGDEVLDWHQSSREIFNFIRAICKPGPMARSMLNGKELKINSSKMIENAHAYIGIPGQVVGKTEKGFIVKTKDTTIEITDYEYDGAIRIGDRLK